jgi:hypothetical protein
MVHIAADTRCRTVVRVVTAGQPHAWSAFEAVMATLRIVRPGQGRRRTRPDRVLRRQGLLLGRDPHRAARSRDQATIPSNAGEITGRAHRGGNVVECTIQQASTDQSGSDPIRQEGVHPPNRGTIDVASIRIWLRDQPETYSRDAA